MKKTILFSALAIAALLFLVKWMDYGLFSRNLSMDVYMGMLGFLFTAMGIWIGLKLTDPKVVIEKEIVSEFILNEENLKTSNISKREYDVLELVAQGLSNQEIADQLFISLNTVKTHISRLFVKLDVKRRTQAIQRAKELEILP